MEEEKKETPVTINKEDSSIPPVISEDKKEEYYIPPVIEDDLENETGLLSTINENESTLPPIIDNGEDLDISIIYNGMGPKEEKPKPVVKAPIEKVKKNNGIFNSFNKVLTDALMIIALLLTVVCLLQFVNADFSNYMWINVNNLITTFTFNLMQHFKFLSNYGDIVLIILCFIIVVINALIVFLFREDKEKKSKYINIITPFSVVIGLLLLFNLYNIFSLMSHKGINEIYMKDNISVSYYEEDLKNVLDYFKSRIITYSESLNRKNGKIVVDRQPYDIVVSDLNALGTKYEFLKGSFPKNIHSLSNRDKKNQSILEGFTYNYVVKIDNDNLTDFNKIYVLTNEFCKVKGIYRNSDANYCAFLSGYNSSNDVSKYAMYINLFPNLINSLNDKVLYNYIINDFGERCLESGYDEICNINYKDIYKYVNDADTIELNTYALRIYKDNKKELEQYLLGLNNRFNISILTSENKQVSLDEANKLIEDGLSIELKITGKIDEKSYNENIKYFKTISNYFSHINLVNSKNQNQDYSNFNYLMPLPRGNFSSLFEKEPEFSNQRSIRSIIEYFDKYIFN